MGSVPVSRVSRICLGCRKHLPLAAFLRERNAKDGCGPFCLGCIRKSDNSRPLKADPVALSKKHWTEIQRTT